MKKTMNEGVILVAKLQSKQPVLCQPVRTMGLNGRKMCNASAMTILSAVSCTLVLGLLGRRRSRGEASIGPVICTPLF